MVEKKSTYSRAGVTVTTVLAMVFGLSIAFLGVTPEERPVLFWALAAVVGVLFIVYLLVPTVRRFTGGTGGTG